jgi:hypothetical protein
LELVYLRIDPASSYRKLIEQTLSLFQVEGIEALSEPAVDRFKQVARLDPLTLVAPKLGKASGGSQFQ